MIVNRQREYTWNWLSNRITNKIDLTRKTGIENQNKIFKLFEEIGPGILSEQGQKNNKRTPR